MFPKSDFDSSYVWLVYFYVKWKKTVDTDPMCNKTLIFCPKVALGETYLVSPRYCPFYSLISQYECQEHHTILEKRVTHKENWVRNKKKKFATQYNLVTHISDKVLVKLRQVTARIESKLSNFSPSVLSLQNEVEYETNNKLWPRRLLCKELDGMEFN